MKISQKLKYGFIGIALLICTIGYFSISLSRQISGLRTVELPMEQNLREVEVSIWEMIHAADAFRLTGNEFYEELYHKQIGDVDEFYPKYQTLTDTDEEKKYIEEFTILWEEAKTIGNKMIGVTREQKAAEQNFFVNVDEADDILDFAIQSKWSSDDPSILAKEQTIREVEVSIWEAIHAAQQYIGLSGDITRGDQKYIDLEDASAKSSLLKGNYKELMYRQFEDVDEFWTKYKTLPHEDFEDIAIQEFEGFWEKAVVTGKELVSLNDKAEELFNVLFKKVDTADDIIDFKMQAFIQKRIDRHDANSARVRTITIAIISLAFITVFVIGLFITHSITSSITNLKKATAGLSKGKFDTKVVIRSDDEIGELSASFNQMVDDLQKSNNKLKMSEEKYRFYINNAPNGIFVADSKGKFLEVNNAICQISGFTDTELLSMSIYDLVSSEALDIVMVDFDRLLTEEKVYSEACYRRKDGSKFFLSVNAVEIYEDKYIGFCSDISERKQVGEVLRESEDKYRAMFESSKVGMALCKMDGTLIECNQAYCGIIGYTKEEVLQLTYWDITPIEFKKYETRQLRSLEETGLYGPYEKEYIQKDGKRIPVLLNGAIVKGADGNDYIWSVVQDITERKNMEDALLQSEKLKSIGTITAGISHEFNNLLAIISGNVQLLKHNYKDHGALSDSLCIIDKAVGDGAEITSSMLKFTKTTPDNKEFVSSDIRNFIRHSIDFTKPRWKNEAQAKGIDYNIDTKDMKSVPSIMCNHAEMREVFINLINNSLDAMPEGGSITFSTWSAEDTLFVGVTDTGEGMSEDVQRSIFDPFFSTKGVDGTGLGMSTVYGIVTRHGGKIEVDSERGKGATFTIQLPTTNTRASLIEVPETEPETNEKSLRILAVDDEEAILNILNEFLSRRGHKVKTVDNGADAIKMIEGEVFDLVICDLAMPDVFGYDVVKVLNGFKKRPKIGIITGWSEERVSDKDMKVDFYLRKPFQLTDLIKHIDELIGVDSR